MTTRLPTKCDLLYLFEGSHDTVLNTVTSLRAGRSGGTHFGCYQRPDRLSGQSSLVLNGYPGSFPAVQRPGREALSSPPNVKVKKVWIHTRNHPHGSSVLRPIHTMRHVSVPSECSVFTLAVVFSHLPQQHVIAGLRLFP